MARRKKPAGEFCVWTLDASEYGDSWDTACGEKYQFSEGGPRENKQRFCGYCGRKLKALEPEQA